VSRLDVHHIFSPGNLALVGLMTEAACTLSHPAIASVIAESALVVIGALERAVFSGLLQAWSLIFPRSRTSLPQRFPLHITRLVPRRTLLPHARFAAQRRPSSFLSAHR
jgi:hypothetical protein